jgi:hypothetical protein
VKIRTYGALTSAFLITLAASPVQAADVSCECPPKVVHQTAARPAPARAVRKHADAEYANAYYDYHSANVVSEVLVHRASQQAEPWRVAPNDANIRFHEYDTGVAYGPRPRQQVALNDNEFTGGVGNDYADPRYGGGGGYQDGYGQVHFYDGGVGENGPTYNSYGQSFGGPGQGGYYANARKDAWHAYNFMQGPSNGY